MPPDKEPDIYDADYVKGIFDRISGTYGITNYLASFGFTARWRRQCIAELSAIPDGAVGFDLMAGRGETWVQLFSRHPGIGRLSGLDISPEMLRGARRQTALLAGKPIELIECDVFKNSIAAESADFIISTFGIKTFDERHLELLAGEVRRILKPGGRFSFIEVSRPTGWIFAGLYMFYLRRVMPIVERLFLGYSYGFGMIGIYVERFGDAAKFARYLEQSGLEARYRKYFFGCASGVAGERRQASRRYTAPLA